MTFRIRVLLLLSLLSCAHAQVFDISLPSGSIAESCIALEQQIGVNVVFYPEFISRRNDIKPFSAKGDLKKVLSLFSKHAKVKCVKGVFGSIVVLPNKLNIKNHSNWKQKNFKKGGIEVMGRSAAGREHGIAIGDVLVKVDGKPCRTVAELFAYVDKKGIGTEIVFTFESDGMFYDAKIKLEDKDDWFQWELGIKWHTELPSALQIFNEYGHQDESWNKDFEKFYNQAKHFGRYQQSQKVADAIAGLVKKGCRDPLILEFWPITMVDEKHWHVISESVESSRWGELYEGSRLDARLPLVCLFAQHGHMAIRKEARDLLEALASYEGDFSDKHHRLRVKMAVAHVFLQHGNAEKAFLVYEELLKEFRDELSSKNTALFIRFASLHNDMKRSRQYLGRYLHEKHQAWLANTFRNNNMYQRALKDKKDVSPNGLHCLAYKPLEAYLAIINRKNDAKYNGRLGYHFFASVHPESFYQLPLPFYPEGCDLYFWPHIKAATLGSNAVMGMGLSCNISLLHAEQALNKDDFYKNASLIFDNEHSVNKYFDGWEQFQPIPGFTNGSPIPIQARISNGFLDLSYNDLHFAADYSNWLKKKGKLGIYVKESNSTFDFSYFKHAEESIDNDRIIALMEKIIDPKLELSFEEAVALWDEAAAIAGPQSLYHIWRKRPPHPLFRGSRKAPWPPFNPNANGVDADNDESVQKRAERYGSVSWVWPDERKEQSHVTWVCFEGGRMKIFDSRTKMFSDRYEMYYQFDQDVGIETPFMYKSKLYFISNKGVMVHALGVNQLEPLLSSQGYLIDVPCKLEPNAGEAPVFIHDDNESIKWSVE